MALDSRGIDVGLVLCLSRWATMDHSLFADAEKILKLPRSADIEIETNEAPTIE